MTDYAEIIKSTIPMRDAVERYSGQRIYRNRIRCPIHHGSDYNMRIYDRSYYCWVCHASGDVIQFVQSVSGLSFQEAMIRLNEDFNLGLPIGPERNGTDRARISELNRRILEQARQELLDQIDVDTINLHQANLYGILNQVEWMIAELAPTNPEDEWRIDWCEAMRVRTELRNELL